MAEKPVTDPVDAIHESCMAALVSIRADYLLLSVRAQGWKPRPCPPREEFP